MKFICQTTLMFLLFSTNFLFAQDCESTDCFPLPNGDFETVYFDVVDPCNGISLTPNNVCGWTQAWLSSTLFSCDPSENQAATMWAQNDVSLLNSTAIMTAESMLVTPGESYTLEYDYIVSGDGPEDQLDEVVIAFTNGNIPNLFTPVGDVPFITIDNIMNPAIDIMGFGAIFNTIDPALFNHKGPITFTAPLDPTFNRLLVFPRKSALMGTGGLQVDNIDIRKVDCAPIVEDCSTEDCTCEIEVTITSEPGSTPFEEIRFGSTSPIVALCNPITEDGVYHFIVNAESAGDPINYNFFLLGSTTGVDVNIMVSGCGYDDVDLGNLTGFNPINFPIFEPCGPVVEDCSTGDCTCELEITVASEPGSNPFEEILFGSTSPIVSLCNPITEDGVYHYIVDAESGGSSVIYSLFLTGNTTGVDVNITISGCGYDDVNLGHLIGANPISFPVFEPCDPECEEEFFIDMCPGTIDCDVCTDGWGYLCVVGTLPSGAIVKLHEINPNYAISWLAPAHVACEAWSPGCGECVNVYSSDIGTTFIAEVVDLDGCVQILEFTINCIDGPGGGEGSRRNAERDYSNDFDVKSNVSIFPNPANNFIEISNVQGAELEIEIYNINGQRQITRPISKSGLSSIDVNELSSGVYIVKVKDLNTQRLISMEKLIIAR